MSYQYTPIKYYIKWPEQTTWSGQSLSMSHIQSITGAVAFTDQASNIQSYYRGSNKTGWSPASGSISFSQLYGGYNLFPLSYGPSPTYSFPSNGFAECFQASYAHHPNGFVWFRQAAFFIGRRGTTEASSGGVAFPDYNSVLSSTVTVSSTVNGRNLLRTIYSGWPTGSSGNEIHPGGQIPIGSLGEAGPERMLAYRTACSITQATYISYWYSPNFTIEMFYGQDVGYHSDTGYTQSYAFFTTGSGPFDTYDGYFNNSSFVYGIRVNTGGTAHAGRYSWPSDNNSTAIVDQEFSMFGTIDIHPNNQLSFSVSIHTAQYDPNSMMGTNTGFTTNLTYHPTSVWYKNVYRSAGWTNGGSSGQNVSSMAFTKTWFGPNDYPRF
jgi:hypothetical protein